MQEYDFARSGHSEDQRVRHLAVMQIQEVRRGVVGFEHGQIFGAEVRIDFLARQDREQERQVGVIGVQQIQPAQD